MLDKRREVCYTASIVLMENKFEAVNAESCRSVQGSLPFRCLAPGAIRKPDLKYGSA